MAKYIVGLTGGIGSGKTTVSNIFAELGIQVIDADIAAREVVAPNSEALNQIHAKFGDDILLANGELNRSLLRQKIFSDDNNKKWLNALLHPLIRQNIVHALNEAKGKYCLLSAPLLIENNLHQLTHRVVVVDVSSNVQIERTVKRDSSNKEEVIAIMDSQLSRNDRLSYADDIIDNEHASLTSLKHVVEQLHQNYLSQVT